MFKKDAKQVHSLTARSLSKQYWQEVKNEEKGPSNHSNGKFKQ